MPAHFRPVSQYIIVCSQYGRTPLVVAISNGYTDIAIALLKAKADVDVNANNNVRVR